MKSVVELAKAGSPAPLLTALTPAALVAFVGGATDGPLRGPRVGPRHCRRGAPRGAVRGGRPPAAALVAALTVVAVNAPALIDGVAAGRRRRCPGLRT